MADQYGSGGADPRDDSQQNNTYRYNYSYGSGSGRGTGGGSKPPRNSNDWGEWIGIGFLLFILPFWFCKLIGVVWLLNKLGKMTASDKRRYKQEAKNAANRAKNTAQDFFRRADASAKAGAQEFFRQADAFGKEADSAQRQEAQGSAAPGGHTYSYRQDQPKQERKAQAEPWESKAQPDAWNVRDPRENKRRQKRGRRHRAHRGRKHFVRDFRAFRICPRHHRGGGKRRGNSHPHRHLPALPGGGHRHDRLRRRQEPPQ